MINASLRLLLLLALSATAAVVFGGASARAGSGAQVPLVGTGGPEIGPFTPAGSDDVTLEEFAGEDEDGDGDVDVFAGTIIDRSLSDGVGNGVSVNSGKKAKKR